jgi:PAS domain S-box-containing protein
MVEAHSAANPLGTELIDCIELPVLVVDRGLTLVRFNPAAAKLLSLSSNDGIHLHSVRMLAGVQNLEELCEHAMATGSSHRIEVIDGAGSCFSVNISCYRRDRDIKGAVLTLTNVTAFRESLGRAIEEREYTKSVVNTIADALVIVDAELRVQSANQAFYTQFQTSRENSQGVHFYQLNNGNWDVPRLRALLDGSSTGNDDLGSLECDHEFPAGGRRTLLLNARRLVRGSHTGQTTTLITIQDITERKRAMEALRESEEELRILDRVGATLASELDLKKLVQAVTDAGRELSQAEFGAFFYNDTDSTGEKYLLYTLSAAPEEAFKNFPMPRNTAVFGPTFRGEGTVRVSDIRQDQRYGKNSPHHGIPAGHLPVRSYLAVPVTSRSGEVIGGLFFGHSHVGVFTERAQRLVEGIAKQAAIAIDNARLFDATRNQRARAEESEKRFRALVNASSEVVYRMSPDWSEMWQLEGRSFISDTQGPRQNWIDVYIHPDDQATVRNAIRKAIEKKAMFELEHRVRRVDGTLGWTLSRAVPVLDNEGNILEWFGAASDVTIRKTAEQALRESEQRFRVITDATPILVWMAGTDKLCYYFNKGWLDFVGRTLQQESGNGWAENVHADDFDRCLQIYVDSFDARRSFEMEYRLRHYTGQYRWILDHGVPRYAPDGTFEGYIGGCLDIHDQKEAAEKIRVASETLRESEERLRLAQQVGTIGTFEWNVQTNVNRWTPELEAIYGLRPGQFSGSQEAWKEMLHPEDRAAAIKQVERAFETGAPEQAEWRVIWPDGTTHWVLGRWQVFKDESGEPVRMTGINIDITSRKDAEQAQRRLAAIVESSGDAIVSKDLNGIVTSWNPAAEKMFGHSANEMIGRSITIVIPPELQADEQRILETIGRGERIEHFETVRMTRSGERIDVSLTISPVKDETGRVIGAAKIARDITQEKKTEQALRTTERLASVGRLAATVAHEINNPLEAVTNLVYLAKGSDSREKMQEYLASVEEELDRISHLTKQTLGFYRESQGPCAVRVGTMLNPLISVLGARARNKGIQIQPEIREDPEIYAVAGEIRQIITNLLSNSIDAVDPGGVIRIRVGAARINRQYLPGTRITVADSGAGIPPAIRAKLFEPFFTTKKDVGTGLGLWVCTNIVKRHHGSIRMKSSTTPGRSWTVFSVFLPSGRASEDKQLDPKSSQTTPLQ